MPDNNQRPAQRHHYVARSYLRRFINETGHLVVYRRGRAGSYPGGEWNVGFERMLYAPDEARGVRQDDVEHLFEQIVDTPASLVIPKLADGQELSLEERATFARCLHLQTIRSPAARDALTRFFASIAEDGVRTMFAEMLDDPDLLRRYNGETGRSLDASGIREMLQALTERELVIEAGKDQWLSFLLEEFRNPKVPAIIATLEWTVVEAPAGAEFLTCDTPVVHAAVRNAPPGRLGGGWNSSWVESTFPLDPNRLLLLRRNDAGDFRSVGRARAPIDWVRDVNRRTAERAAAEVYLREDVADVPRSLAESPTPSTFVAELSEGPDRVPHIRNPTVAGLPFGG